MVLVVDKWCSILTEWKLMSAQGIDTTSDISKVISLLHRDVTIDFSSPRAFKEQMRKAIYKRPFILPLLVFIFSFVTFSNLVQLEKSYAMARMQNYKATSFYVSVEQQVLGESVVIEEFDESEVYVAGLLDYLTEEVSVEAEVDQLVHEVKEGESLWSIAELYYGNGDEWGKIFDDNESVVGYFADGRLGVIEPGTRLFIPVETVAFSAPL